jgi:6-phosphogluconolactonase
VNALTRIDLPEVPRQLFLMKLKRNSSMSKSFLLLSLMVGAFSTGEVRADLRLYLANRHEDSLMRFDMDETSGELTLRQTLKLEGEPAPMCVSPDQRTLYVARRKAEKVSAFSISPKDGSVKLISETSIPGQGGACYLSPDRSGKFLLSAYYFEGKVAVHRLRENGSVKEGAIQTIATEKNAHCILPDHRNRLVLVPHTGPNAVYQFIFNEKTGKLSPSKFAKYVPEKKLSPRHVAYHPDGKFVYVVNEGSSSVTACHIKSEAIHPIHTLSTLPADFKERNTCADVEVHPSGKFLYCSNRGHDSVAMFSIDEKTGRLTSLGQERTEKVPRSFNVDPTGKFLVAAGLRANKLTVFQIDQGTGKLKPLKTYDVGKGPTWVQILKQD